MEANYLVNHRAIFEFIYFLSGPLLVIIGCIGLTQLNIAKKDITLRCKREAATLATLQCQRYFAEIIPLNDELYISLKKEEIVLKQIKDIKEFSRKALFCAMSKEQINKLITVAVKIEIADILSKDLNAMESFAVYFVKGVADEDIAFSSVGLTFCNSVERLYPFICILHGDSLPYYYHNIVMLYQIWSSKAKKYNLENLSNEIKNKLKTMKVDKIDPIGL